jgi:hypothetical protein
MVRSTPKPPLMIEVMIKRVGYRKALKVFTYMAAWEIVCADGRAKGAPDDWEPTVDQYAIWWKESRSQAFRDQQLFRACLPGETTPSRVMRIARESRTEVAQLRAGKQLGLAF